VGRSGRPHSRQLGSQFSTAEIVGRRIRYTHKPPVISPLQGGPNDLITADSFRSCFQNPHVIHCLFIHFQDSRNRLKSSNDKKVSRTSIILVGGFGTEKVSGLWGDANVHILQVQFPMFWCEISIVRRPGGVPSTPYNDGSSLGSRANRDSLPCRSLQRVTI
jgi:hypothetical protein